MVAAPAVNAQIRQRASASLEQVTAELQAVTERSHEAQREKHALAAERMERQAHRDALQRTIEATSADRDCAMLELAVSMGSPVEDEARSRLAAIDELLAAAIQDVQAVDIQHQEDAGWTARELDLTQVLSECAGELEVLHKKRGGLAAIHTRVHEAHGKDERGLLISEFEALAAQEQATAAQLHQVADLRSQLQATISTRLADWPSLALELEMQYGPYSPDPQTQILTDWLHLIEQIEQHAKALEPAMVRELDWRRVPIGTLAAYGRRDQQRHPVTNSDLSMPEMYNFNAYIVALERIRDAMIADGTRRQADARVYAPPKEG